MSGEKWRGWISTYNRAGVLITDEIACRSLAFELIHVGSVRPFARLNITHAGASGLYSHADGAIPRGKMVGLTCRSPLNSAPKSWLRLQPDNCFHLKDQVTAQARKARELPGAAVCVYSRAASGLTCAVSQKSVGGLRIPPVTMFCLRFTRLRASSWRWLFAVHYQSRLLMASRLTPDPLNP